MSDPNDTFLREVEQEYRRDRMAKLFDKYGAIALASAIAIVAVVAGYVWYTAYQRDIAEKAGARFTAAMRLLQSEETTDRETALKDFRELAEGDSGGYATLARLKLAGQLKDDGKADEARALFERVAGDGDADAKLRSFAQLQVITLDAPTLDWDTLRSRLGPLMAEESAWRFSARELLAVKAVSEERTDDARQLLAELLGAAEVPPSIRQRAEMMLSMITVRAEPTAPQPRPEDAAQEPERTETSPNEAAPADADQSAAPSKASGDPADDTKKPETPAN